MIDIIKDTTTEWKLKSKKPYCRLNYRRHQLWENDKGIWIIKNGKQIN